MTKGALDQVQDAFYYMTRMTVEPDIIIVNPSFLKKLAFPMPLWIDIDTIYGMEVIESDHVKTFAIGYSQDRAASVIEKRGL